MNTNQKMEFLSGYHDFWDHLSKEEREFVCRNTEVVTYHPGQNIHSADIRCVGVLFVKKGCLRVYIMSEEGKEVTLYRVNAGEVCILSASCVLAEITFDAYVDSEEQSEVVVLNAFAFAKMIENNIYVENFSNKMKAIRFSDENLKAALTGYLDCINTRNENARKDGIYEAALELIEKHNSQLQIYIIYLFFVAIFPRLHSHIY